jgi:6-phosphogluconolactonase (cycloisomerase 2 family)
VSVDATGEYLLTAYNDPSNVTVHRLNADGTIGAAVAQPNKLDTGIYAHQVLTTPSNRIVLLVTRGNDARPGAPEDPGAIKTFAFDSGVLTNLASIAPGNGLGFGPRHLDFHPTKPWVFVSIERQNKLYVYRLNSSTGLDRDPMFVKETLPDPNTKARQGAGTIHVHPVFAGGENSAAAFSIDEQTGEPKLMQNIDGRGIQLRTFGIDPSGRVLIAVSIMPLPVREGNSIGTLTAGLTVFRMGGDGRLELARKYDVDTGGRQQFWSGMVTLP